MWKAEVKYTETYNYTRTSEASEFEYLDEAQSWAEKKRNGFWHKPNELARTFVPPDNVHKVLVEKIEKGTE